jgi:hypothetical protein
VNVMEGKEGACLTTAVCATCNTPPITGVCEALPAIVCLGWVVYSPTHVSGDESGNCFKYAWKKF